VPKELKGDAAQREHTKVNPRRFGEERVQKDARSREVADLRQAITDLKADLARCEHLLRECNQALGKKPDVKKDGHS
jgi:hypothetical protein